MTKKEKVSNSPLFKMTAFICGPRIYEFGGWVFEYGEMSVWPLKKNFEPRKRAGGKFFSVVERFARLPKTERERYRIGGGCFQTNDGV